MSIEQLELEIIECIKSNIEESGDEVPDINRNTEILSDIPDFDSLRAIEVLIDLEDIFECELPPEKIFTKYPSGTDKISDIAKAVHNIRKMVTS